MLRYFSSDGYTVLSTKHDHLLIQTLRTCSCICGIGAAYIEVPIYNTISITLNWLVILLSSLNSTTYVLVF